VKYRAAIILSVAILLPFVSPGYQSKDYSGDGTVTTICKSDKSHGIDIVIMGDGFTDRDFGRGGKDGLYEMAVKDVVRGLFLCPPSKFMQEYFNVYSVKVVSPGNRSTAFDISPSDFGNKRNDYAILTYAKKAPLVDSHKFFTVVILNSAVTLNKVIDKEAGGGTFPVGAQSKDIFISIVSLQKTGAKSYDSLSFRKVVAHEVIGHAVGLLADEYSYIDDIIPADKKAKLVADWEKFGGNANIDFGGPAAMDSVKWCKFIELHDYPEVGLFQGGATYTRGVWRPTQNSIMRNISQAGGDEFNPPSREAIYKRIKTFVGEECSWEDFLMFDRTIQYQVIKQFLESERGK